MTLRRLILNAVVALLLAALMLAAVAALAVLIDENTSRNQFAWETAWDSFEQEVKGPNLSRAVFPKEER